MCISLPHTIYSLNGCFSFCPKNWKLKWIDKKIELDSWTKSPSFYIIHAICSQIYFVAEATDVHFWDYYAPGNGYGG